MKKEITDFDGRKPICTLTLPFKGQRNYLHGTDISHAFVEVVGAARNVTIQFHRMCMYPLKVFRVVPSDVATLRAAQQLCSVMAYEQDDERGRKIIVGIEDTTGMIDERRPYDEMQITKGATFTANRVEHARPSAGNFFERVVALNKVFLNNVVEDRPWFFSEIKLNYTPLEPRKLSLSLARAVGGHSYKSTISGDDVVLGTILFTRQPG